MSSAVSGQYDDIPRLVLVHAVLFGFGLLAMLIGVVVHDPRWFIAAGPALVLSGGVIWVGSRITSTGASGAMLRVVLGPARVRGVNVRAIVWIVAGLLVCLWGLYAAGRPPEERGLEDPLVQTRAAVSMP